MKKIFAIVFALTAVVFFNVSCQKYLEAKPDSSLAVPNNLEDLQAILDNVIELNIGAASGEVSSDDYFLRDATWSTLNDYYKNLYTWGDALQDKTEWQELYQSVFYSNTVLDHLGKIPSNGSDGTWNNIKGSALFFRAHSFYQLSQVYAKQYDKNTASKDLGIPIRITSDFNNTSIRSTVQQTYDQIIQDLRESISLLPNTPLYKTRPSKPAAFGLLARVFLIVGDYDSAKSYADSCLSLYNYLLDYNNSGSPDFVDTAASAPFQKFNNEVIFHSTLLPATPLTQSRALIDTNLIKTYNSNDLRRSAFFKSNTGSNSGTFSFKGSYDGSTASSSFNGIAVNEIYLIRAESNARLGNVTVAMNDLNNLLRSRWKKVNGISTYTDQTATNGDDALNKIFVERRKELIRRGLRWVDLTRFTKLGVNIVITRQIGNQTYSLPPNDNRYTLLIPQSIINLTEMPQNPR